MGPWFAAAHGGCCPSKATHTLLNPPPSGFCFRPPCSGKSLRTSPVAFQPLSPQATLWSPGLPFFTNHSLQSSHLDVLPWVFFPSPTLWNVVPWTHFFSLQTFSGSAHCRLQFWPHLCTENSQICTLATFTTTWSTGHPHLVVASTSRSAWLHH